MATIKAAQLDEIADKLLEAVRLIEGLPQGDGVLTAALADTLLSVEFVFRRGAKIRAERGEDQ